MFISGCLWHIFGPWVIWNCWKMHAKYVQINWPFNYWVCLDRLTIRLLSHEEWTAFTLGRRSTSGRKSKTETKTWPKSNFDSGFDPVFDFDFDFDLGFDFDFDPEIMKPQCFYLIFLFYRHSSYLYTHSWVRTSRSLHWVSSLRLYLQTCEAASLRRKIVRRWYATTHMCACSGTPCQTS